MTDSNLGTPKHVHYTYNSKTGKWDHPPKPGKAGTIETIHIRLAYNERCEYNPSTKSFDIIKADGTIVSIKPEFIDRIRISGGNTPNGSALWEYDPLNPYGHYKKVYAFAKPPVDLKFKPLTDTCGPMAATDLSLKRHTQLSKTDVAFSVKKLR